MSSKGDIISWFEVVLKRYSVEHYWLVMSSFDHRVEHVIFNLSSLDFSWETWPITQNPPGRAHSADQSGGRSDDSPARPHALPSRPQLQYLHWPAEDGH